MKKYYAFISHRSSDDSFAIWLKKKLERYIIPRKARKTYSIPDRHIKPVCLYQFDFAGNELCREMENKLDESNKMILLCSPKSASPIAGKTDWSQNPPMDPDWWLENAEEGGYVGFEIAYMLKKGRLGDIIPVVIDGDPIAGDCFHPLIKNHLHGELLWYDFRGKNKNNRVTFLKLAAPLMGVGHLDALLTFDAKRQNLRRAAAIAGGVAVLAAGIVGWNYFAPHTHHYRDYVLVNGIPQGIDELSKGEYASLPDHYIITTKRAAHSVKLTHVNSRLTPVADESVGHLDAPMIAVYRCRNGGSPDTVEYQDRNGIIQITYAYTTDMQYVSFQENEFNSTPVYPSTEENEFGIPVRLKIDRYHFDYDEDGRLIRRLYMSGVNYVVNDEGAAGEEYSYDEEGRLISLRYLNRSGNVAANQKGIAGINYVYDSVGEILEEHFVNEKDEPIYGPDYYAACISELGKNGEATSLTYYDMGGNEAVNRDGFSRSEQEYDVYGDLIKISYYAPDGTAAFCEAGYHRAEYEYNDKGERISATYFNEEGKIIQCAEGYARITWDYDKNGNVIETAYFAADGEPLSSKNLAALVRQSFNAGGYIVEQTNYGMDGNPIITTDGYYRKEITLDNNKRASEIAYFDAEDHPVYCKEGYHKQTFSYDRQGNLTEMTLYGTQGQLVPFRGYWAIQRREYNGGGQITRISYFDQYGNPTIVSGRYASLENSYDDRGLLLSTSYYDTTGQLTEGASGSYTPNVMVGDRYYAKIGFEYDEAGNVTRTSYYGEDGQLLTDAEFAMIEYSYDETGRQICEQEKDATGNLISGAAIIETGYDVYGNTSSLAWYDAFGKPVRNTSGYCKIDAERNIRGDIVSQYMYLEDGSLFQGYSLHRDYDDNGKKIKEYYLAGNGKAVSLDSGYAAILWEYDNRGLCTQVQSVTADGKPVVGEGNGYAILCYTYDENGVRTGMNYYDESGKPVNCASGYASLTERVNVMRNTEELILKDTEGNPLVSYEVSYKDYSFKLEESLYGKDGKLLENKNYGVAKIGYEYDDYNYLTSTKYYGADGNLKSVMGLFAGWTAEYDDGLEISRTYYDSEWKPTFYPGGYATVEFKRNKNGQEISRCFYGLQGEPIDTDYGFARYDIDYSAKGEITGVRYYHADGSEAAGIPGIVKFIDLNTGGESDIAEMYDASTGEWTSFAVISNPIIDRRIAYLSPDGEYDCLLQPYIPLLEAGNVRDAVSQSLASYIPTVDEKQESADLTEHKDADEWKEFMDQYVEVILDGSAEDLMVLMDSNVNNLSMQLLSDIVGGSPTVEEINDFYVGFYGDELETLRTELETGWGDKYGIAYDILDLNVFTDDDAKDEKTFVNLGVVKNAKRRPVAEVEAIFRRLREVFDREGATKEDVVAVLGEYLPNFHHIASGKGLDGRM